MFKNKNRRFIFFTILSCTLLIILLILGLNPKPNSNTQLSLPNIVTIVGTVLTIGALTFTIREQIKLQILSDALSKNNKKIQSEYLNSSFNIHLAKCIRYVHEVSNNTQSNQGVIVLMRLGDLKECLIDCSKIVHSHEELTQESTTNLPKNVTLQPDDRHYNLKSNVLRISKYIIAIEVAGCSLNGIRNRPEFISYIERLGNYLNEINNSVIYKVK